MENSDLSEIKSHISTHSKPEPAQIDLQFSRGARKFLKRVMPLKHLKKHETDKDSSLKCHKKSFSWNSAGLRIEKLTKQVIIAIIYMALNLTKDNIQLSDLIRFLNEGHLSYYDVKHFFPENISAKTILRINLTYNKTTLIPSHRDLRIMTAKLCKFMRVQLVKPNMLGLCSRYLIDLSLPPIINEYIRNILEVCPSEIEHNPKTSVESPNYEGRAISYIIFLLKLLFKLDGKAEEEISRTAEILNTNYGTNIFVWSQWVKFIETRNIILKQCHFPTSILLEPDSENSSHLYLEYVNTMKSKMSQELTNNNEGQIYSKMKSMLIELKKLHKQDIKKTKPSYIFKASLQPSKDYLDNLLQIQPEYVVIPDYMSVNHFERDLSCYIKPNSFRNKLLSQSIDLSIYTISNANLQMADFFFNEAKIKRVVELKVPVFYKFIIEADRDGSQLHNTSKTESESDSDEGIYEPPKKTVSTRGIKLFSNQTNEPLTNYESKLFDDFSDDEEPIESNTDCLSKIPFNITNFEYWTYMGNMNYLNFDQFSDVEFQFPLSFAWLLNECSRSLQMDNRDLYHELLVTENYFCYVIKPFEKDQKNLLLQFRCNKGIGTRHGRESIKKLKKLW